MANVYKLYDICGECKGTGVVEGNVESVCPLCNGAKIILKGYCTEAVTDVPEVPAG